MPSRLSSPVAPRSTTSAWSWGWILLLSSSAAIFLVWLIYFKGAAASGPGWVAGLPAVNALLNASCAACLVAGFVQIRHGRQTVHKRFMLSALALSVLFLVSYVTYHHFHGDTPFPGRGWIRPLYFFVLSSHIVLSIIVLPLVLATVTHALRGRFPSHRRIARVTFPLWLYVSVTGVLVFFLLRAYS